MASHSAAVTPPGRSIIIGLDFGTYGSGFAYTINGSAVSRHENYPDAPLPAPKTRTCLLYSRVGPKAPWQVDSWGWTAERKAPKVMAVQAAEGGPQYKFVENFKLALDPGHKYEGLTSGLDAQRVIADYLRLLSRYAKDTLRLAVSYFHDDLVQWALTVPAAWDDAAKDAMRRAAAAAGLAPADAGVRSDALMILVEPEAAALAAQGCAALAVPLAVDLCDGDTFMILDAGGGTVDITVHKVSKRGGEAVLSEAVRCRGKPLGSTRVDAAFEAHLREQVGPEAFAAWQVACPDEWFSVRQKWEIVKCGFRAAGGGQAAGCGASDTEDDDDDDQEDFSPAGEEVMPPYVPLPPGLHRRMDEEVKLDLSSSEANDCRDDRLYLDEKTMKGLFQSVIDGGILPLVDEALAELQGLSADAGCAPAVTLLMVGGFSDSPYLQQRVAGHLEGNERVTDVVTVPNANAAVVQGAAIYGTKPHLVFARRARLSYGVRASAPYRPGAPGKYWSDEHCYYYTDEVFYPYISVNELVPVDKEVPHIFLPFSKSQTAAEIELYGTDQPPPLDGAQYTSDESMIRIASVRIAIPEGAIENSNLYVLTARMKFGASELKVTARDEQTGQSCETSLQFAYERVQP